MSPQHVLLLGRATVSGGCHVDPRGHVPVDVKMSVESPGGARVSVLCLEIGGCDRGQRFDDAAVDGDEQLLAMFAGFLARGLYLVRQFPNDGTQPFGVEDVGRFRELSQRRSAAPQLSLHDA